MGYQNIFLAGFLMLSSALFSQKNEILISPSSMSGWSSIIITTQNKENHTLIIKDVKNNKILFSKNLGINKRNGFKHNFSAYSKGKYTFIVKNSNKEIVFSVIKIKE